MNGIKSIFFLNRLINGYFLPSLFTSVFWGKAAKFLKNHTSYKIHHFSESIFRYPWVNVGDDMEPNAENTIKRKHYWEKCHNFTRRESINSQCSGEFLLHLPYTSELISLRQKKKKPERSVDSFCSTTGKCQFYK